MPVREDLLNPIAGDNPSGKNLYYDPLFDKIKEARREDDDAPQGDWKRERKVADWTTVIKLAGEALATKSKDLQLMAWLTEAYLKKEGLGSYQQCLIILRGLLENFWDTLYPELEDGEAEFRAAPVEWIGSKLVDTLRAQPITKTGLSLIDYRSTRLIPTEEEANYDSDKGTLRQAAIDDGKLLPEAWDKAFAASSREYYEQLVDQLDSILTTLDELQPLLEEKFGEFTPSFSPTRAIVEEIRHQANQFLNAKGGRHSEAVEEAEPEAASDEASSESYEEEAAPAVKKVKRKGPRISAGAEPQDREDAIARAVVAAQFMRKENPSDPAPYLLLRGLRFGELRANGEYPDDAMFEAPPTELRQALKAHAKNYEWDQVLELAEEAMGMPCGRAWLDLQRYADAAAYNLSYSHVSWAIRSCVRSVITDLPNLPNMTLLDDTPTANAETKTWLDELMPKPPEPVVAAESASSDAPMQIPSYVPVPTAPEENEDARIFGEALQAAKSGRAPEAVEMLTRHLMKQTTGRGRFQSKTQLAQLMMNLGRHQAAYSLLNELASLIDRHNLETWEEPATVSFPLTLLYQAMDKVGGDGGVRQDLYLRICRVDPQQALLLPK